MTTHIEDRAKELYEKACRWNPPHWYIGWDEMTEQDRESWRRKAREEPTK